MTSLTLSIVTKTLFDTDVDGGITSTVGNAMLTLNQTMVEHINMPIPVPKWWPSKTNQRKLKAIEDVENIVKDIINERRREGVDRGDLLSMLVFAEDEDGNRMSDRELRDQSMTLFFAGHETTAISLVWMLYLMSQHPEVVVKMRAELDEHVGDRTLCVDDLGKLPYLEMVVKESMRILPAVWSFMKETIEDVELGDYLIPKGSMIFISPYVTQHNPLYFPEPDEFRPERFTKENEKALPKGAYVPFSAGQRICLGKMFALMESKLILGTMVNNVDFVLPEGHTIEFLAQLSLHPKGGLPMQVVKRKRVQERQTPATPEPKSIAASAS
jgi:cytochrome P450